MKATLSRRARHSSRFTLSTFRVGPCTAAFAASTILLSAARVAIAVPPDPYQFEWVRGLGGKSCPGMDEIARDVVHRLDRNPFAPKANLKIVGEITHENGKWVVRIRLFEFDRLFDVWRLFAARPALEVNGTLPCRDLKQAIVLAIGEIVGGPIPSMETTTRVHVSRGSPPSPPAPVFVLPPVVPPSPLASEVPKPYSSWKAAPLLLRDPPASPPYTPPPVRISMVVRGAASTGLLPGFAPGIGGSAGVEYGWVEVLAGMVWLPESVSDDGSFAVGLTSVWLGTCVSTPRFARLWPRFTRISLTTCGSVLIGATHVVATSASFQPREDPWPAIGLAERLRVTVVSPYFVELDLEVVVPLTRYVVVAEGEAATVFGQARPGFLPSVGLGVSFP